MCAVKTETVAPRQAFVESRDEGWFSDGVVRAWSPDECSLGSGSMQEERNLSSQLHGRAVCVRVGMYVWPQCHSDCWESWNLHQAPCSMVSRPGSSQLCTYQGLREPARGLSLLAWKHTSLRLFSKALLLLEPLLECPFRPSHAVVYSQPLFGEVAALSHSRWEKCLLWCHSVPISDLLECIPGLVITNLLSLLLFPRPGVFSQVDRC